METIAGGNGARPTKTARTQCRPIDQSAEHRDGTATRRADHLIIPFGAACGAATVGGVDRDPARML